MWTFNASYPPSLPENMAMKAQWKSHEILNFIGWYQWILISWNFHRADQWKPYEKPMKSTNEKWFSWVFSLVCPMKMPWKWYWPMKCKISWYFHRTFMDMSLVVLLECISLTPIGKVLVGKWSYIINDKWYSEKKENI